MELTYIEIKKITNLLITKLSKELKERYDEKSINDFLKKYNCENIREFVEKILCSLESPDLSLSIRETLEVLTNESHQLEFELDLKTSQYIKSKGHVKYLQNELNKLNNLTSTYNEKMEYVDIKLNDMELVLKKNNLNFNNEIKKIKPTATPPKPPKG